MTVIKEVFVIVRTGIGTINANFAQNVQKLRGFCNFLVNKGI